MMPLSGLKIYLRLYITLIFDLLTPNVLKNQLSTQQNNWQRITQCNQHQTPHEIYQSFELSNYDWIRKCTWPKRVENDASVRYPDLSLASCNLDLRPPGHLKLTVSCPCPVDHLCQFKISRSQDWKQTNGWKDGQTDGCTDNPRTLCLHLPVWSGHSIKTIALIQYRR